MKAKKPSGISNPFVFTKRAAYMQRIADAVSRGQAHRYVTGQISTMKAGFFAHKIDLLYRWSDGKVAACRARKEGFATCRLFFLYQPGKLELQWILLATEGRWRHSDAGREPWKNPYVDRPRVGVFELVREIREGKDPSHTWGIAKAECQALRLAVIHSIRSNRENDLKALIDKLWRFPGFGRIRRQVNEDMKKLIKAEWRRTQHKGRAPPLPAGMGYVRRIPDKGMLLTTIFKELQNAVNEGRRDAGTQHPGAEEGFLLFIALKRHICH